MSVGYRMPNVRTGTCTAGDIAIWSYPVIPRGACSPVPRSYRKITTIPHKQLLGVFDRPRRA